MNLLFPCDHMHEVGRGTDSGKEWNYAPGAIRLNCRLKACIQSSAYNYSPTLAELCDHSVIRSVREEKNS